MSTVLDRPAKIEPWHVSHSGSIPPTEVRKWVMQMVALCRPEHVYWCNGSGDERQSLLSQAVRDGVLIELNQQKLPNCYLHRSNPNDVARTEQCTFICAP